MARRPAGQASRRQTDADQQARWRAAVRLSLWGVAGVGLAGGLAAAVWWARDPAHLPLRTLEISGELRHLDRAEIAGAIGEAARGGFFTVDVDAVRGRAEALPWVRSARVRRIWPDRLRVEVEEQQPVARWGERALLNAAGERFMPPATDIDTTLPRLQGPEALSERVMRRYVSIRRQLAGIGRSVRSLTLTERRAWRLELDNGVLLNLGREDTERRMQRFVRVYPGLVAAAGTEMQTVDMRYSNGFAVRWQERQQTAPGQEG